MTPASSVGIVVQSYSDFISSTPVCVAQGLAELGHPVTVITTGASDARAAPYPKESRPGRDATARWEVVHVPYAGVLRDNVLVWPSRGAFPAGLDCLVLHEDYPILSGLAASYAFRHSVPYFIASERYYYPPDLLTRSALRVLDRTWGRHLWERAALGVYHTRACLRFFTDLGPLPGKTDVIPGVIYAEALAAAVSRPSDRPLPDPNGPVRLLAVARLTPYKGIRPLLGALAILARRGRAVQLRVLGRGPEELRLRAEAQALGLTDRVRFDTAPVPNAGMYRIYEEADIYVQPSLAEPFGSAVIEAMAAGLPVVASAVGGMLDTVEDGVTGFLAPADDPPALAERLDALVTDPARRRTMGEAGQKRSLHRYDYHVVSRTYADWIHRLVG